MNLSPFESIRMSLSMLNSACHLCHPRLVSVSNIARRLHIHRSYQVSARHIGPCLTEELSCDWCSNGYQILLLTGISVEVMMIVYNCTEFPLFVVHQIPLE